jgi:parallel beta-helix repeat protein
MLASALKNGFKISLAIILVAACLSMFSSPGTAGAWPCDTNLSLLGTGYCFGDGAGENWVADDTYCLDANVIEAAGASPDCMIIDANNVVLDCYGFSITGPAGGHGITIGGTVAGATINDCTVASFADGIKINSTGANNNVSYSSFTTNVVGINLTGEDAGGLGVDSTIIQNNNIFVNTMSGLELYGLQYEVTATTVANNNIYMTGQGVILTNSSSNTFSGNRIYSNTGIGLRLTTDSDSNTFTGEVVNASGTTGYDVAAATCDNNLFSQCSATDNALAYYDAGSTGNWLYNFSVYNAADDATTNFSITSYTGSISINDTAVPADAPRTSVGTKALAFTTTSATINYLSVHFTDAERIAAGLTTSTLRIWRNVGGTWDATAMSDSNITGSNVSTLIPATLLAIAARTFAPLGFYIAPEDPYVPGKDPIPPRVQMIIPPPILTCAAGGKVCCAYGCNGSHYGIHDGDCKGSDVCCSKCAQPIAKLQDNTVFVQGDDALQLTGSSTKTQADITFVFVAIGGGIASLGAIALLIKSVA